MTLAAFLTAPGALAQRWEFGGAGGASFYNKRSIAAPAGSVDAKFNSGFAASAYFGQIGNRLGGEMRYDFHVNEMELSGLGRSVKMDGRSQAFHYDVLVYFNKIGSRVRPYLLGGVGMKYYQGTSSAGVVQPLMNVAVLTDTSQWKPLVVAGGGIRFEASKHVHVRAEFRVNMTQAPTQIITPVSGELDGWYFNYAPIFGVSYVW
jgi:opacity protein-like surface antigen